MVAPYRMSFTAVSLALTPSLTVAEYYAELRDWPRVRQRVLETNALQARSPSSAKRVYQEIEPRMRELSPTQLQLLVEGSLPEKKALLWYAICKRYAFIRDFAAEVVHGKFLSMDLTLDESDYYAFVSRKAERHAELDELKPSTRRKTMTVLLRMLREAGLLSDDHQIVPLILSERLIEALEPDGSDAYHVFPTYSLSLRA